MTAAAIIPFPRRTAPRRIRPAAGQFIGQGIDIMPGRPAATACRIARRPHLTAAA